MKRILALDGGGIKGAYTASFLAAIEEKIEGKISDYFDLIAGTSTGGIIALGLSLGIPAEEILEFYKEYGPDIFSGSRMLRVIRQLGISKYSPDNLRTALENTFENFTLADCKNRVVIPTMNLETGEVYVYKTPHHPRLKFDATTRATEVALSTSAAPTFFPTLRNSSGAPLIDGGVWANNPTGVAVVEAVGLLEWNPQEIFVMSVGCTEEPLDIGLARWFPLGLGKLYWAPRISSVFLSVQSSASMGTAILLTGHSNENQRIYRISSTVPKRRFSLDKVVEFKSLAGLGHSEARKKYDALVPIFFTSLADPFIPEDVD